MLGSMLLLHKPEAPSAMVEAAFGIDQLSFLVGGTWVARPDPDEPATTLAETCKWALGGAVIVTSVVRKELGEAVATAHGVFEFDKAANALRSQSISNQATYQTSLQTGEVPKPPSWVFLSIVGGAASGRNQVTMAHVAPDEMLITSKPIPASEGAPPAKATTLAYRREPTPP